MINQPTNEELYHTNIEYATLNSEALSQSEQEKQDNISFQQFFKAKMTQAKLKMKEVRKDIREKLHEVQYDMNEKSKEFREHFKRSQRSHSVSQSINTEFKEKHPKFCPQCGNPVSSQGQFCPLCGFRY